MYVRLFACALVATLASGCASIQSGPRQDVSIKSNPEGAAVYTAVKSERNGTVNIINKQQVGVTPIIVNIARKDGVVFVEKEGYEPVEVQMQRGMNPWVWGDIVLTSLLSTSIDTSTGAAYEYDPGEYLVDLKPLAQPAAEQK